MKDLFESRKEQRKKLMPMYGEALRTIYDVLNRQIMIGLSLDRQTHLKR